MCSNEAPMCWASWTADGTQLMPPSNHPIRSPGCRSSTPPARRPPRHERPVMTPPANTKANANANTNAPAVDSREGAWIFRDDYQTFLRLVAAGRLRITPLISTVVPPSSAADVYHDLSENPNPPLGVLFDWTGV